MSAHHVKIRAIKFRFQRSAESISRQFNNVINPMMRLEGHLFKKLDPIPEDFIDSKWKFFKVNNKL